METVIDRIKKGFESKTQRHKARNKSQHLYQRLYNFIKDSIINADIPDGSILPPTRILAEKLDLSRTTVIRAYELLRLEGYIDSHQGSKHIVKKVNEPATLKMDAGRPGEDYPELSDTGKSFLGNVSLINSTDDQSIAFRPGLPPLDIFPVQSWKNLSNLYWRYIKSSALSYSPSSGIEQLKKNIANYINLSRGIKCDHRQIFIVSGSLQSLYLLGSVLINAGDKVIMENPTFPNVYSIFKGLRAKVESVGIDENGILTDRLNDPRYAGSKILHCTPTGHYPTGIKMSVERMKSLLDWAENSNSFIIENDYEHEVHHYKSPMPTLYKMDQNERVIYLSTFNRLLHPSIRLGYMVVPPYLLGPVDALLRHSHRFVPPSIQVVFNQFIEKNHLSKHVKKVVEVAEEREKLFRKHFNEAFDGRVLLRENNTRSLQLLAELNSGVEDKDVVGLFAKHNIITHAYSKCFTEAPARQGFILGYSSVRPPVIKQKVGQMADLYRKHFK